MILESNELRNYISGAVDFEENDGLIPYRFTKQKIENAEEGYDKIRHLTGSGIKIDFYSDTESVCFDYIAFIPENTLETYRHYFFDIYCDGKLLLHQGEQDITGIRQGRVSANFGDGMKHIIIYIPNSCSVKISDFCVDDGAVLKKNEYSKNVFFFGDSITHAAYPCFPSLTYTSIISERLNYNAVNQAIGGDIFDKKHLSFMPDFKPDIIFVAYGTNDWKVANETCSENADEYFSELVNLYKDAEVNVILPIWRKDMDDFPHLKNSFTDIRNIIRETAKKYNFNVIDGFDFVPRIEKLYFDGFLHPNEMGFTFYADSLEKWITARF